jgi:hypothetical protein
MTHPDSRVSVTMQQRLRRPSSGHVRPSCSSRRDLRGNIRPAPPSKTDLAMFPVLRTPNYRL